MRIPLPLRLLARAAVLSLAGLLAGCTQVLNATIPDAGYRVERDIAYGQSERQRLDLYVPKGAAADAPVLVFFYGGSWDSGSKDLYKFAGQAFASRGYVTAIPDYRVYPEVRFPGFVEDGAAAIAAVQGRLGGRRPLFVAGHSAGAHIAMMLALDPRWLERAGACPGIDAAVGLAGPYDFLPLTSQRLREVFGPGPAGPETQPITFAGPGDPPVLLLTGDDDTTVRPANSLRLAQALQAAGGTADVKMYDGLGHLRIVGALAAPLRFLAPVLEDVDAFLKTKRAGPRAC